MNYKYTSIIEKDDYGYYAYCPELKGCQTEGETYEEAVSNLKEAVELYIETLDVEELTFLFKKEVYTSIYEVSVA